MLSRSSLSVLENNNTATLYNSSVYLFLFMCDLCSTLLIFINVNISVQIPLVIISCMSFILRVPGTDTAGRGKVETLIRR